MKRMITNAFHLATKPSESAAPRQTTIVQKSNPLSIFTEQDLTVDQLNQFISNGGDPFTYYEYIAAPIFGTIGWPLLSLAKNKNKAAVDHLLAYTICDPWVQECVNANGALVKTDYNGASDRDLLFYACLHGWNDIVEKLVTARPEMKQKVYESNYAGANCVLGLSLVKKNVALANKLIDLGANIAQYTDSYSETTLMAAAHIGDVALVKRILNAKTVDVNAKNRAGNTALHYCINENHGWSFVDSDGDELHFPGRQPEIRYEILNLLLQHGANPVVNGSDNDAFPALLMRVGAIDLLKELLDKFPAMIDMSTARDATLLHAAAANNKEIVAYMLQKRPYLLNKQDDNGYTPLMWAARRGKKANVELLLQHDADPTVEAIGRDEIFEYFFAVKHRPEFLNPAMTREVDKWYSGHTTDSKFRDQYAAMVKDVMIKRNRMLDTASSIAQTAEIKQLIDNAVQAYMPAEQKYKLSYLA